MEFRKVKTFTQKAASFVSLQFSPLLRIKWSIDNLAQKNKQ